MLTKTQTLIRILDSASRISNRFQKKCQIEIFSRIFGLMGRCSGFTGKINCYMSDAEPKVMMLKRAHIHFFLYKSNYIYVYLFSIIILRRISHR